MYVRIVTFGLDGLNADADEAHAAEIADGFNAWPGLRSKLWLADPHTGAYGGVYVFDSRDAADASRHADLFRRMEHSPHLRDLRIREFDVLDTPTAVTAPSLAAGLPQRVRSRTVKPPGLLRYATSRS